ncbi:MAG: hypothetical protein L3J05_02405, partial [Robiginitomaculum sp.]|nr:hypothetical protein [Robiginitomaculum sp.]
MVKIKSFMKAQALVLALVALSACATTLGGNSAERGQSLSPDAQLYADYVSARYASNLNDATSRSAYFSRAFARRPNDLDLGQKALAAAINNGDSALARTLSIEILALDETDGSARAVMGANALAKGRYKK